MTLLIIEPGDKTDRLNDICDIAPEKFASFLIFCWVILITFQAKAPSKAFVSHTRSYSQKKRLPEGGRATLKQTLMIKLLLDAFGENRLDCVVEVFLSNANGLIGDFATSGDELIAHFLGGFGSFIDNQ